MQEHQAASATPSNAIQLSQSAGCILIGIDELAEILHRAPATIRTQATREPHKLPRRISDGTNSVLWRLYDVWAWLDQLAGHPATPAPSTPSNKPLKRRGAPTAAEKLAAKNAGYASVAVYRRAWLDQLDGHAEKLGLENAGYASAAEYRSARGVQ